MDIQIERAQYPQKMSEKYIPRNISVKFQNTKDKEKSLKAFRENVVHVSVFLAQNYNSHLFNSRCACWMTAKQCLQSQECDIYHPAKLSNEHGVTMKLFAEIQPPKQTSSGVLQDILHQNELICTKKKESHELK